MPGAETADCIRSKKKGGLRTDRKRRKRVFFSRRAAEERTFTSRSFRRARTLKGRDNTDKTSTGGVKKKEKRERIGERAPIANWCRYGYPGQERKKEKKVSHDPGEGKGRKKRKMGNEEKPKKKAKGFAKSRRIESSKSSTTSH